MMKNSGLRMQMKAMITNNTKNKMWLTLEHTVGQDDYTILHKYINKPVINLTLQSAWKVYHQKQFS